MKLRPSHAKYFLNNEEHHLDVRPVLENGGEPFSVIMEAVQQLEEAEILVVHAHFDPVPLKKQLQNMGFKELSTKVGDDHWTLTISLA